MEHYKIVVTGAYAAGKTQFIRSISEIDVVDTEVEVTDAEEAMLKANTTVGLDYGIFTISDRYKLFLFGTPGQERFDFMWEVLTEGCLGYIVIVDSCRPAYFKDTTRLIERFAQLTNTPFVVAANKQDDPSALPPEYIRRRLALPPSIPVLPCVALDADSVLEVITALIEQIEMVSVK